MINKLYDEIKNIVKQNIKFIITIIVLVFVCTFQLPFYIEAPGGLLDVSKRVEIENAKEVKGTFNLAYVSEFRATLPTLLFAYFNDNWDILTKKEVVKNETVEEIEYRNNLLLEEANDNATIVGFNKASEYVLVTNRKVNVIHIHSQADTDLKIGDEIIKVNDNDIESKDELLSFMSSLNGKIEFSVINNGNLYTRYGYKKNIDSQNVVGIVVSETKNIDTNRNIQFKFRKSESGPSGGFMMALSIYNYLTSEDITKGLKIVGTGTIDALGNVGSIGGIQYKIKAACKAHADLFFVPVDNYEEAKKTIDENNLRITLISVSNIDDAIKYLNEL